MADDVDDDSKTEEPTEKRIADAVARGDVPVSREVTFLGSLGAYLLIEAFVLPSRTGDLANALMHFIDDPSGWRLEQSADLMQLLGLVGAAIFTFLAPAVVLLMGLGAASSGLQNTPRIVIDRIMPDFSRISIRGGIGRMFGMRGFTEFFKALLKLAAVGVVVSMILMTQRYALFSSMFSDVQDLPGRLLSICTRTTAAVFLTVLVIAGADFTWARIHWRRDHRMSRQELKEEVRQAEGDRMMKARFRSLALSRMRKRMLASIPKATMVIVNPTHYAIAMRYVRSEGGAPTVLAKGVDLVALKIREIATEHDIPIVEDKPLARSLYDAVQVDDVIPPEFYRAVAEIVHLLQQKNGVWPMERRRIN
jgi:flagellar biosynthetic protein FlhB